MTHYTGGCLCGAVRYEGAAEPMLAGHCQCRDCRRHGGTGHTSHFALPEESLAVTGTLCHYETRADSGNVVDRGFCPLCGSPILFKSTGMPGLVFVTAGSLDDPSLFRPAFVVFAASAPAWDRLDPSLQRFVGMPPSD